MSVLIDSNYANNTIKSSKTTACAITVMDPSWFFKGVLTGDELCLWKLNINKILTF